MNIDNWNTSQKQQYFCVEENPPELAEYGGGLKTQDPDNAQEPREVVYTVDDDDCPFRRTIVLALCAHGRLGTGEKDEACLVVMRVHLACDKPEKKYKSVDLRIRFTTQRDNMDDSPPEVISWAPFKTQQRSAETEVDYKRATHLNATVGAEQVAKADATAGMDWEKSFKKTYFKKAQSDLLYEEGIGKKTGIKWWLGQNEMEDDGVETDFHLLMLVKPARNQQDEACPFDLKLELLRCDAGMLEPLKGSGLKTVSTRPKGSKPNILRDRKEVENAPVSLDQSVPIYVRDTGERLRSLVTENLQNLQIFIEDGLLPLVAQVNKQPVPESKSNAIDGSSA